MKVSWIPTKRPAMTLTSWGSRQSKKYPNFDLCPCVALKVALKVEMVVVILCAPTSCCQAQRTQFVRTGRSFASRRQAAPVETCDARHEQVKRQNGRR